MNNNIYFNAAFTGFLRGALSGRQSASVPSAEITDLEAAAVALGTAIDAAIPFSALVSQVGGAQLLATTATEQANMQWRAGLLHDVVAANFEGRWDKSTTFPAALITAIVTEWTNLLTSLVIP